MIFITIFEETSKKIFEGTLIRIYKPCDFNILKTPEFQSFFGKRNLQNSVDFTI